METDRAEQESILKSRETVNNEISSREMMGRFLRRRNDFCDPFGVVDIRTIAS
jgi:hypothetical protein